MLPSLLFTEPTDHRGHLDADLFLGSHLGSLFGEQTLELLRIPCNAEEIAARQYVFSKMENEEFFERLKSFSEELTALFQAANFRKDAQNECEDLLSFYTYATSFVRALRLGADVDATGEVLGKFSQYFQDQLPLCERLEPLLSTLQEDLHDIYTSRLYFSPIGTFATQDEPCGGILQTLRECAGKLDICEINLPSQRTLPMPPELSSGLLLLYPMQFEKIRQIKSEFGPLLKDDILQYRKELSFFFNVRQLCELGRARGAALCYPELAEKRCFLATAAYDVSLFAHDNVQIVPNDISFTEQEPFFFLTGANGGGKTTFLRTVSANLVLACTGCPIFAKSATFSPFSFVGAHFPADETHESGRLVEELSRVEELFSACDESGFLFFNETFSGANDKKGLVLTLDCAERCKTLGVFGLFVTHFHEVNGHDFPVLSTVVDAENENRRTYKIERNRGVRSSYAEDILRKYRLSHDTLDTRGGANQ